MAYLGRPERPVAPEKWKDPLITNQRIRDGSETIDRPESNHWHIGAAWARDEYEAKRASGELITKEEHERLVKKALDDYREDQALENFWE